MNKIVWVVAAALPCLLVACAKPDCPEPVRDTNPKADQPVATLSTISEEEKAALRKRLDARIPKSTIVAEDAAMVPNPWEISMREDLRIDRAICTLDDGTEIEPAKCHLYVKKTATPSPARWLRVGSNGPKHYWVIIRSVVDPKENMYCSDMTEDGSPSYISGWCTIKPHTGDAEHWVLIHVVRSASNEYKSVYFEYYDKKPVDDKVDVHNGEGHGGDS